MPGAPSVELALPSGEVVRLFPGAIIGRMARAELRIDDPRVSEAHALLSQRGRKLVLLGLRGVFQTAQGPREELVLAGNPRVALAQGLELEVRSIDEPATVLAIDGLAGGRAEAVAPVCSLEGDPPRLVPGYRPGARAWLFLDGDGTWWARVSGEDGLSEPVAGGESLRVGGRELALVDAPASGVSPTVGRPPLASPPLTVQVRYSKSGREHQATVRLLRPGHEPVVLAGTSALLVWGVVASTWDDGPRVDRGRRPVHKDVVMVRLWSECDDKKWSTYYLRLKDELRKHGLQGDLLAHEKGIYCLNLKPEDALDLS